METSRFVYGMMAFLFLLMMGALLVASSPDFFAVSPLYCANSSGGSVTNLCVNQSYLNLNMSGLGGGGVSGSGSPGLVCVWNGSGSVSIGTASDTNNVFTVTKGFSLGGTRTVLFTGTGTDPQFNNYDVSNVTFLDIDQTGMTAGVAFSGFAGGTDGRMLYIRNRNNGDKVFFFAEHPDSATYNRIETYTGFSGVLLSKQTVVFRYNANISRWQMIQPSNIVSSTDAAPNSNYLTKWDDSGGASLVSTSSVSEQAGFLLMQNLAFNPNPLSPIYLSDGVNNDVDVYNNVYVVPDMGSVTGDVTITSVLNGDTEMHRVLIITNPSASYKIFITSRFGDNYQFLLKDDAPVVLGYGESAVFIYDQILESGWSLVTKTPSTSFYNVEYVKHDADGAAADEFTDHVIGACSGSSCVPVEAYFVPDGDLTANKRDYAVITVNAFADGSGLAIPLYERQTTTSQTGDWSAFVPVDLGSPSTSSLAGTHIYFTLNISKAGGGVVVPSGLLVLKMSG